MKKEQIRDFTLRITQSNKTGIIVILFEMIDVYLSDALQSTEYDRFRDNIRSAQAVIYDLRKSLDFNQEIALQLESLYSYWYRELEMMIVRDSRENLPGIKAMIGSLGDSFEKISSLDTSLPVMSNTEKVYAGLTYDKNQLTESYDITTGGRGFLA